ncbi:hypothetical protein [Microcoleus sp. S13C4]|uniref:hypothetical protein n=1 Tax=Microcoleus sp. S13C4 TaxID=3055410 RepID=UPI002FCEBD85
MILLESTATTIARPTSPAFFTRATQPKIWEDATAAAQPGDVIRKPFCPIARVVNKEILKDGRVCLVVIFPNCDDQHVEEWVIATPIAQTPAPTAPTPTPAAIGTNGDEPPNRGDNGRGRVQPIAKTHDRTISQLAIIREELAAIGIKFGKLIKSREDVKGWNVSWDGDKAGLYWTIGNGWEIASLKYEAELTGNWEGFDLMEHLDCNGIELPE